jgi:thiamine-phosphate pyrophosphorylase
VKPLADCLLYSFVDTVCLRGRSAARVAGELCDGGSDLIQLRAKHSSVEEVREIAEAIEPIIHRAGVGFVINDYPAVAASVGADLCHLGQEDFFGAGHVRIAEVSNPYPGLRFGLSTHDPVEAARALAAEPAYVAVGPVYATNTKPEARPVTLEYVRWASANVTGPWFAIGGINLTNLDEVLEAGARRICVVSAILNAPDVTRACRQFRDRLE